MCYWTSRKIGKKDKTWRNNGWKHPILAKDKKIQEASDSRRWMISKLDELMKFMPGHIIIEYLKTKDRGKKILKAAREKQHLTYKEENLFKWQEISP